MLLAEAGARGDSEDTPCHPDRHGPGGVGAEAPSDGVGGLKGRVWAGGEQTQAVCTRANRAPLFIREPRRRGAKALFSAQGHSHTHDRSGTGHHLRLSQGQQARLPSGPRQVKSVREAERSLKQQEGLGSGGA